MMMISMMLLAKITLRKMKVSIIVRLIFTSVAMVMTIAASMILSSVVPVSCIDCPFVCCASWDCNALFVRILSSIVPLSIVARTVRPLTTA
jgi:hypothetical protein